MDDGFQHLPLKKHISLIIDDGTSHNRSCLPAGPYREPRHNRKRATKVVPDDFKVVREPLYIVSPGGEKVVPTEYALLCALGQPSRFIAGVKDQFPNKLATTPMVLLQDHDPLTAPDLWKTLPPDLSIIVTAKDWVKLRDRADVSERTFLIARQEVRLEPREQFETWVERSFNE
jgi:tetraacyldisaccharide 4'-kinase